MAHPPPWTLRGTIVKCIEPDTAPLALPPPEDADDAGNNNDHLEEDSSPSKSRAARALRFIQREYRLVFSTDKKAYAVDDSTCNPQVFRVDSPGFASAVRRLAYRKDSKLILTGDDMGEIRSQLEALAELTGEQAPVWPRIAETDCGIEIDIGDDTQARIAVQPGSVRVLTQGSPTLFHRNPNFLPFVMPAQQGDINKLLPYLNLVEAECWLLIAWITYTLALPKIPSSNYVILVLRGDRGSGKSTMCNITLGSLVGPSVTGVQAFPSSQIDLAIALQNAHVQLYDNIRGITPSQSDWCCRGSTSAAISTRMFYTNGQEYTLTLHGAMVLNGIHPFIDQADLAQRCLTLTLQPLDPAHRTTEKQLRERFQQDLPVIFKGVLDLIAATLMHLPTVTATHPERMLEFVLWLAAMEKAMGLPEGQLQKAYSDNLVGAMADSLQDNPLADAVLQFAQQHTQRPWAGTPADLLLKIGAFVPREIITTNAWPQNEISLSLRLKKLKSQLSGAGVDVVIGRRSKVRQVSVQYSGRSS
jgi:hypothetical protein